MLTLRDIHKRYSGQVVLDGASWFVPDGARVGLVGANGSGKSTLLRIICGQIEPDQGAVVMPKEHTVGYLPQEVFELGGDTVLGRAMTAFADIHSLASACAAVERELEHVSAADPRHAALMERYARLRSEWDARGSYDTEFQARQVLAGLGFAEKDLDRDCGTLSGGWQMRVALAKLLLQRPNLLLLDEPTNHLDIEARNWLEEFLAQYPHTVILVAHDRYFLDVVVDRISELSHGQITDFHTDYSRYLVAREERRQRQEQAYREQQEEIARIEAFISRFRYQASKAALVQSRIKQLEKIERLKPPEGLRTVHFRFPQPARSGRIVLQLRGVSKSYGDLTVYKDLDLTIERGKKIALVGPNGAGKSTLMRLLAGVEPPDRGEAVVGHNVTRGYFAQDQTQVLDPRRTVLEEMMAVAPIDLVPQLRSLLGSFLFSGDAVDKRTSVLSGGERNRLALAKLLVRPTNCLLLDEPTNHLDIHAKEVLLDALTEYTGTVVFVAHDRYILDRLPGEVIEVGARTATRYIGNYEDYLRQKAAHQGQPTSKIALVDGDTEIAAPVDRTAQRKRRDAQRRRERELQRRLQRAREVEATIASKESELGRLAALINRADFYQTHESPHSVFSTYAALQREIEGLYCELEKLEKADSNAA